MQDHIPFDQLTLGQTAELSKTITEADVQHFAALTLDTNPVHLDADYAAGTFFKQRIAHGMFGAGLISGVLGTRLPGPGSVYVKQDMKFKAPVYLNETITAKAEITELNADKKLVTLNTHVYKQDGTLVIEGQAVIKLFK